MNLIPFLLLALLSVATVEVAYCNPIDALVLSSPIPVDAVVLTQPVRFIGYVDDSNPSAVQMDWSGIEIHTTATGASSIWVFLTGSQASFNVFIDGKNITRVTTVDGTSQYLLVSGLNPSQNYSIRLTKRSEADAGVVVFGGFALSSESKLFTPKLIEQQSVKAASRKIAFYGDSITCGYGDMGFSPCPFSYDTEDNLFAYGGVTGEVLSAEIYTQSWSGKGLIHNYGDPNVFSDDPIPSYLNQSVANDVTSRWNFSRFTPDAAVINLGTNDYSSGDLFSNDTFINAYLNYIAAIRTAFGVSEDDLPVFVVCGPMMDGPHCSNILSVAILGNNVHYVDMEDILTAPQDNGCNGHPSYLGHRKMADILIASLRSVLNW